MIQGRFAEPLIIRLDGKRVRVLVKPVGKRGRYAIAIEPIDSQTIVAEDDGTQGVVNDHVPDAEQTARTDSRG